MMHQIAAELRRFLTASSHHPGMLDDDGTLLMCRE
jgi:hypothetical protein